MKKTLFFMLALAAFATLQAQWVDDPLTNTFIANASADGGEIYLATDEVTGDTYLQWCQMRENGWVPTLQRLNFEGVPQWGADGITITGQQLATWSQGVAMAATTDGGVVSCFSNEAGQCIAVRINADGSFAWGEQGIVLFDGQGGSRTELLAGDDGGVWALGADYDNTYLCYIHPDGTTSSTITISDSNGKSCVFGLMVPGIDNSVFVVYEKETWAYTYYYEKEIWVVGYTREGVQIGPEEQLMSAQTIGGSFIHYVVPDGLGGGYAYIWHPAFGNAFNIYVFHFDHNGHSTISDLNGIPVHSQDPENFYLDAYATVDPESHELIIVYERTDAMTQSESSVYMNRITSTGEKPWGDGISVAGNVGTNYSDLFVDAFEDGNGFMVSYNVNMSGMTSVFAIGYDMQGDQSWAKNMSVGTCNRAMCENSTGFHLGQNIIAWVNSSNGGIYGQNIGPNGTMGTIENGIEEQTNDEIVSILKIFNVNGQSIAAKNLEELGTGLYILQGLTQDGKLVSKKIVVNK
ncbi:MAG: T9SS type A sorting domain-containing protein [Bacteroidales bacterium]|nr:T9SS type A sorting domain-containing protein [Bacteroidales bacterium]